MRIINTKLVEKCIYNNLLECNIILPECVTKDLKELKGSNILEQLALDSIIENSNIAENTKIPICQDTGIVEVFVSIGRNVIFDGNLHDAINTGIHNAYIDGHFRKSVVSDPLNRINTLDNTPGLIYFNYIEDENFIEKVQFTIIPKGAGSENQTTLLMLNPTTSTEELINIIVSNISKKATKSCPPLYVGIGIGGDSLEALMLAKKAIYEKNTLDDYKIIANEIKKRINETNIGALGFTGLNTIIDVQILTYPCHIATLPVAINFMCHANRFRTWSI